MLRKDLIREPGSFRDPGGHIGYCGEKVFRVIMPGAAADFEKVQNTGLFAKLIEQQWLIPSKAVDPATLQDFPPSSIVVEHPRIPFVSYPYEWCFHALQDAAIRQLEICLTALEYGAMVSDASAYNIQFVNASPVFIDHLSFRPYEEGKAWNAHAQYCEQFLNPLLLRALLGIPHNAWYRGNLEGIPTTELSRLIPFHRKFSWNVFTHVVLHARIHVTANKRSDDRDKAAKVSLDRRKIMYIMENLKKYVGKLSPKYLHDAVWHKYTEDNSYGEDEEHIKRLFITDFLHKVEPQVLLDFGCNTGDYSALAWDNGTELIIGLDNDHLVLEEAYLRARREKTNFLPLYLDIANPSPSQGWDNIERKNLKERVGADAIFALALLHHLVFSRNIPLDSAVAQLVGFAPNGVIEFIPKTDPKLRDLLLLRKDVFPDYTESDFENCLRRRAKIVDSRQVTTSGRRLYWYARN